jgi:hypothetical protein
MIDGVGSADGKDAADDVTKLLSFVLFFENDDLSMTCSASGYSLINYLA